MKIHPLLAIVRATVLLTLGFGFSARAAIQLQFDYTYDSSAFFAAGSQARGSLEAVGDFYESILADDLLAIKSSGSNHFTGKIFQPNTGASRKITNLDIAVDTIRIYVGAYDLGGNTLGQTGPGGYSYRSMSQD